MQKQVHHTREAWSEARHGGVGASEWPIVLGIAKPERGSLWSLWQEKVDRVIREDYPDETAEAGHRLEPVIAQWFQDKCRDDNLPDAFSVVDPGEFTMYWAVDLPIFATPDRFIVDDEGTEVALLELKCAWWDQAKRFRSEFPLEYRCQVQVQMFCAHVTVAYYAVLLNGMKLVWFREEYNDKFVAAGIKKVKRFWEYVEARTPPPDDFTEATSQALAAHYCEPEDEAVQLPEEFDNIPADREAIKAKIAELQRKDRGLTNKVKARMGNSTIGRLASGTEFIWRPDARGIRSLRTSKRKE